MAGGAGRLVAAGRLTQHDMAVDCVAVHIRMVPTDESGRRTPVRVAGSLSDSYKPHFRVGCDGEFLGVAFVEGPDRLGHEHSIND